MLLRLLIALIGLVFLALCMKYARCTDLPPAFALSALVVLTGVSLCWRETYRKA